MVNKQKFDVVVVGAGPAGLVAAAQAARIGARTLLIEKSGIIGGTTVLNGVNYPGLFHAWGQQVIKGIGWELIQSVAAEDGVELPDFSTYADVPHHRLQILVNRATYAGLADQLVIDSGAQVLLHSMIADVSQPSEGAPWQVTVCSKEGLSTISTSKLVDCTGDANVVGLAGYRRSKQDDLQPGTLTMHVSGFDPEALDYEALEAAFLRAVESGEMLRSDLLAGKDPVRTFIKMRGSNSIHVTGIDASSSAGKTQAEFKARAVLLRIQRFMRRQPKLENFKIVDFAPECGIRETNTIEGEYCITTQDYSAGRVWDDSYCYSFYPIDIHASKGGNIDTRELVEGVFPTIPLRAMVPKGSRDLVVAGRCVCGDQAANSAFRVQASAMATGQVAGAVAAVAALEDTDILDAPKEQVMRALIDNDAIVPNSAQDIKRPLEAQRPAAESLRS